MFDSRKSRTTLAALATTLALAGAALLAGCQEDLAGGAACPSLCPEQGLGLKDTVLFPLADGVALDTTLVGYPPLGTETELVLTRRGDTLVTGAVFRFDTVLSTVTISGASKPITGIDTAYLQVHLLDAPLLKASTTFEVYDVDTTAADLDTAAVRSLFRPDRLLATRTIPKDSISTTIADTINLPVPSAYLLARATGGKHVRLGVLVSSDSSVSIRLIPTSATTGEILRYLARSSAAATDTQTVSIVPSSRGTDQADQSVSSLTDFGIVLVAPPVPPASLVVGGIPASRSYLRFVLPAALVDSTTVVRASLVLTQHPNLALDPNDSITVAARLVRATDLLNADPGKAALLLSAVGTTTPSIRVLPSDSGQKVIEIASFVRVWRADDATKVPRALVLQAGDEATAPHSALFFSREAAVDSLRPRLRITYVPTNRFGLP